MNKVILNNIEDAPYSVVEAVRVVKTNITFSGENVQVVELTSCMPGEGKSTVSFNVAKALADSNKRVLLLDLDMRKSVLASRLRVQEEHDQELMGLSHILSGQCGVREAIYQTNVDHLYLTLAGPPVPDPTALLDGTRFAKFIEVARGAFDYIIVDSPPIGAVIDAAIAARHCDGVVFVVGYKMAHVKVIKNSIRQMRSSGVRVLGAVLNKMPIKKREFGKYYGKYYGQYYGQ